MKSLKFSVFRKLDAVEIKQPTPTQNKKLSHLIGVEN